MEKQVPFLSAHVFWQVPKGPQLKIQRACREAGLESQDKTAHAPAAFSGSGSGSAAGFPTNSAVEDDSSDCNICFERKIEVKRYIMGV